MKEEMIRKNLRFNRYLLLRYVLALFFFSNLYWLLNQLLRPSLLILLPILLILMAMVASAEQFRLYGQTQEQLQFTQFFLRFQLVIQLGLTIFVWTDWFTVVFPIFEANFTARGVVFSLLSFGIVLSLMSLKRIRAIYGRKDKAYQRLLQLEKVLLSL